MRRQSKTAREPAGRVRIIGGQWRGRVVEFRVAEGLRPSPDRVRETLFNWLAPHLPGARCLDLYCGSGVLGLEALSRGAESCLFIDRSAETLAQLQLNIARLRADGAATVATDALAWIATRDRETAFDIVFVDPPYRLGLAERTLGLLVTSARLAAGALIYVESAGDEPPCTVPSGWVLHRDKRAGQVAYRLFIAGSA